MKISLPGRVLARAAVTLLSLSGIAAAPVAVGPATASAQPQAGAVCSSDAHVYANGANFKWESDPLDGPVNTIYANWYNPTDPYDAPNVVRLGGDGIEPSEDPFWNIHVESNNAYVTTYIGNRTHSNCVSNEKDFPILLDPGTYIVYAFYYSGNHGTTIQAQKHFRLVVSA